MMKVRLIVRSILIAAFLTGTITPACGPADGVDFRILTDKSVYAPGSTMRVSFLVTNTGESPLYFSHNLSVCSSQLGSYLFFILDQDNREIPIQRCSSDVDMANLDVVETLTNAKLGIRLRKGEIYGLEMNFKLPAKNGAYRLKATLMPAGFDGMQQALLDSKQMKVLKCSVPAPAVTVTVK